MRFRDYRDRETRSRWLEVQLSRREALDGGLAAWLERTRDRSLLEMRIVRTGDAGRGGSPRDADGRAGLRGPAGRAAAGAEPPALLYDVTGLVPLPELLRADAISRQQYEAMLFSVADLATALGDAPCTLAAADFRPQHVFALDDGTLRFLVLPVARRSRLLKPPGARDLLRHLATGRSLRFISDEDMRRAERLVRLLDSMQGFDAAAYLDFLEAEYGVRTGARPQGRPRREGAGTTVAAGARPAAGAPASAGATVATGASAGARAAAGRDGAAPREVPRTMLMGSLSQDAWDDTWGGSSDAWARAEGPEGAAPGDGGFSAGDPDDAGFEAPEDFDPLWATGDLGNTTPGSFGDMGDADDVPTSAGLEPEAVAGPAAVAAPAGAGAAVGTGRGGVAATGGVAAAGGASQATATPGGAEPAFWLVRESTGERYPLDEGVEDVLGRSSACDVQILGNLGISRMHASVVCEDGGVEIFDLGSENGVVLKSGLLPMNDHAMVAVGERFMLADELFHVERGAGA